MANIVIVALHLFGCQTDKNAIANISLDEFSFINSDEFKRRGFIGIDERSSSEVSVCFEGTDKEKTLLLF